MIKKLFLDKLFTKGVFVSVFKANIFFKSVSRGIIYQMFFRKYYK